MLTTSAFLALALQCAPSIHPATLTPIVKTESAFNPWAIGVVGRALPRQPQNLEEAVTAVNTLVKEGANFSIGLGQINRQHFDVAKPEVVFDPCTNLRMTATILEGCYASAVPDGGTQQEALHKAISCYYSGNKRRGFQPEAQFGGSSHVQRVVANADITTVTVPALTGAVSAPQVPVQPVSPPPQPTYESWDVLRQYPRYMPAAQPSASDLKPEPQQEIPKEKVDV
ncbi:lytic transglycosylase domain-containing protein [Pseudomonas sp. MF5691]|uniref:lytic transglycosylase domain-containing protein n=1 Tax=Pseudomonas sp. MF5691 TaxID=2797526 RepID=UPI0018E8FB01|nr:lytic transglycosylase domain-containing protein [Pseudomonas sp. MF5691]MBJ2293268.1 lytic transglycosylase domain-containing protein [Pseudomonas sp. MF5691]